MTQADSTSGGARAKALAALFGTAFALALLAAAEGAIRLKDRWLGGPPVNFRTWALYEKDPDRGVVLKPGARFLGDGLNVHVNSLGFRGAAISPEKPAGTVRIAVLGGSAAFGAFSSSDAATFPARMEAFLQARPGAGPLEVINAGVPGYHTRQMLAHLERQVLPLHPDVVVFYEAYNDLKVAAFPPAPGDYATWNEWHRERYRPRWWERLRLTGWFYQAFLKPIQEIAGARPGQDGPPPWPPASRVPEAGIRAFREGLEALVRRARKAGAKPVLSTYAHALSEKNFLEHPERFGGVSRNLFYLAPAAAGKAMAALNAQAREAAKAAQVPLVEMAGELPPTFEMFHDEVHFEDAGAARAGAIAGSALLAAFPGLFGSPAPGGAPAPSESR